MRQAAAGREVPVGVCSKSVCDSGDGGSADNVSGARSTPQFLDSGRVWVTDLGATDGQTPFDYLICTDMEMEIRHVCVCAGKHTCEPTYTRAANSETVRTCLILVSDAEFYHVRFGWAMVCCGGPNPSREAEHIYISIHYYSRITHWMCAHVTRCKMQPWF